MEMCMGFDFGFGPLTQGSAKPKQIFVLRKWTSSRVIPCQLNQFLQKFPGVRLQYC